MKKSFLITILYLVTISVFGCSADKGQTPEESDYQYDIYLLIGQSNMAGRGYLTETDLTEVIEGVYLLGSDDTPVKATHPFNQYSTISKDLSMQQMNPGYSFSKTVYTYEKKHPILIVCNARGGTSITEWAKGTQYYEEAVRRTKEAMKYGKLKGILWHQGCADGSIVDTYMGLLTQMVANLRSDLDSADLPFIAGELPYWRAASPAFNEMLHTISANIPASDWVSAEDCGPRDPASLETSSPDPHFSRDGQILLGKRYAEKVIKMVYHGSFSPDPEPADSTIAVVLKNIQTYTNSQYTWDLGPEAQSYMNLLNAEGAFSDIDYSDTNKGNWKGANVTYRMQIMAIAYVNPNSSLKGSDKLYDAIVSSFSYWATLNLPSPDWWYRHIDSPQKIGLALCMLRSGDKQIPVELENTLLDSFITKPEKDSYFTGANKQDISIAWMYLYTLKNYADNLTLAARYYYEPLTFTTEDGGFQNDWSFHQHTHQFMDLHYGSIPLSTFPKVAAYLDGTSLYNKDAASFLGEYTVNGIIPLHRGRNKLYTAGGRMCLSYAGGLAAFYTIPYAALLKYMPEYADAFNAEIARESGTQSADYMIEPLHIEYWRSDYTLHQRPAYTVGMRACSKNRVRKCEIHTSGCNHLGYFLSDGGTDICIDGEEYVDIFPVWKWDHVPSITCPTGYSSSDFPVSTGLLTTDGSFTGGVSDGKYGCSVYDLVDNRTDVNTAAHKGYFFFDNEVVFLGSAVKSTNTREIHTTVNQCNLDGAVTGETSTGSPVSTGTFSDLRWLCHDKVCYYFPENANITVSAANQSGRWSDVNVGLGYTTPEITSPVFLAYVNHGTKPTAGKYAYIVLPGKASIAEGKAALDDIIYGNETNSQWVYNRTLDQLQAIFYAGSSFTADGVKVAAAKPCAIMITNFKRGGSTIYAADPSYSIASTTIMVGDNRVNVKFDTSTEYQGKTISATL